MSWERLPAEMTDLDRLQTPRSGKDRRGGEDRRKNPVEELGARYTRDVNRLQNDLLYYQREYHQAVDRWAATGMVCFIIGIVVGMVGLTIARMLW